MELINKFLTASRIDGFINNEEVIAATNVTIANEYAMKFANWCMDYKRVGRNNVGDMQFSKDDYDFKYTMPELLNQYNKENK